MDALNASLRICIASGALLLSSGCRAVDSLPKDSRAPTASELFDLRTRCSELAAKIEADAKRVKLAYGTSGADIDNFTNRYDPVTNHCYVERLLLHAGEFKSLRTRSVIDGQEKVELVGCSVYSGGPRPDEIYCSDKDQKTISLAEANSRMNSFMGVSLQWP
jgi:hypothetical protein